MSETRDLLQRIATALDRLAPAHAEPTDWLSAPAYVWDGSARAIGAIEAPPLDLLKGIDRQKQAITANVARLAEGHAAHDMLLWGARGMGKSALLRAAVRSAQEQGGKIAMVQVTTDALPSLSALFARLAEVERNFLVFIDDLGFAEGDSVGPRHLRSWLDGGVEARPANVRLAVTSNRRAIVARHGAEQDDPLNPRDAVDDNLALADRFGLSLGFHVCSQDEYLAIARGYAEAFGLSFDEAEALEWAKRRGARSGRTAWHFITELSGRAGKRLD
ncbi:ATP-binding protein [Alteraurantiacibacter aquimixticola]|uniref:ATP-binding protein n=1 Tax=Alteraurantiacibacter aquimixticola TaxID=2489173 RepID=A0A4T3EZY3_9SPHN|nr:ATP-binding protein [Alteraurantiacibacter aquimixticola]TIX49154.1 ATP-binding protein [Alteraurantiacibacter aquimixticola]